MRVGVAMRALYRVETLGGVTMTEPICCVAAAEMARTLTKAGMHGFVLRRLYRATPPQRMSERDTLVCPEERQRELVAESRRA